jgi:hypothetical protein
LEIVGTRQNRFLPCETPDEARRLCWRRFPIEICQHLAKVMTVICSDVLIALSESCLDLLALLCCAAKRQIKLAADIRASRRV